MRLCLLTVILGSLPLLAFSQPLDAEAQGESIDTEFHIGVWYCPWGYVPKGYADRDALDEAQFRIMQEYGIDTVIFAGSMDAARKTGMNMILFDGAWANLVAITDEALLETKAREAVRKYPPEEYPNLLGYYLTDEPTAAEAPQLGKVAKAIHKADPNRPIFTYIPQPAHLDPILSAMNAKVLCHHIYPLHPVMKGFPLGLSEIDNGAFDLQVRIATSIAEKRGIPAHIMVPAFEHSTGSFRRPREVELDYMTWYPILCGARSINYFIWNSISKELMGANEELYGLVTFSYEPTYLLKHLKKTLKPIVRNKKLFGQWRQTTPTAWLEFTDKVHINFFKKDKTNYIILLNPSLDKTIKGKVRFSEKPSNKIVDLVSGKEYTPKVRIALQLAPATAMILTEKTAKDKRP